MESLIVTGGNIDLDWLDSMLKHSYYTNIIAVDKGLEAFDKLGYLPNHIVGDFDSVHNKILEKYQNRKEVIVHPYSSEKDYTDTHIALELALQSPTTSVTIIGATGTRIDHSLANIHILVDALKRKIPCKLLDPYNQIQLVDSMKIIKKNEQYGKYVSFIPLTSYAKGVTLTGFLYPLNKAILSFGQSLGISNEILQDEAIVTLKEGILIMIESKDV